MEFYVWRISLKVQKWILVLCLLFFVISRLLQTYFIMHSNGNDISAIALAIGAASGLIIANVLFLVEEKVEDIEKRELLYKENIVCTILFILSLSGMILLKALNIPLIDF